MADPKAIREAGNLHKQQFVQFRVSVYRLVLPNDPQISVAGVDISINELLASNFNDNKFRKIAELANGTGGAAARGVFIKFLEDLYAAITKAISSSGGPTGKPYWAEDLIAAGIFQEIDITPLVTSYSVKATLDDVNSCSITAVNPSDVRLWSQRDEYNKNSKAKQYSLVLNNRATRVDSIGVFDNNRPFRVFDLVRVWEFVGNETPQARMEKISKTSVPSKNSGLDPKEFVFRPAFTGFVSDISESNSGGGASSINVSCAGVKRMFMQSVSVYSEALASNITTAAPELDILNSKFTVFENQFNEFSADEVIAKIFIDYLCAKIVKIPVDGSANKLVAVGIPSLSFIMNRMYKTATAKDSKGNDVVIPVNLIPMLPAIILLHILKLKYREPIILWDDRLKQSRRTIAGSLFPNSAVEPTDNTSSKSVNYSAVSKPYLTSIRSSFSNFDSSYVSASEVMDTVRATSFLEIFEDKTGCFHFRFPRYNEARIDHYIPLEDTVSVDVKTSDSAVFTASVAQNMEHLFGNAGVLGGSVFLDKTSILMYGLRRPQNMENPNANSQEYSAALAKFARDYSVGRNSRTASLAIIGRPSLEPGDLIAFGTSRRQPSPNSVASGGDKTYCGYIVSVSEGMRVSTQYIQTLELAFVREASIGTVDSSGETVVGPLWDAVDLLAHVTTIPGNPVDTEDGDNEPEFQALSSGSQRALTLQTLLAPTPASPEFVSALISPIEVPPSNFVSTRPGSTGQTGNQTGFVERESTRFLFEYDVPKGTVYSVNASYIPSALDLAFESANPTVVESFGDTKAIGSRKEDDKSTASDFSDSIESIIAQIESRVEQLADYDARATVLNEFLKTVTDLRIRLTPQPKRAFGSNIGAGVAFTPVQVDPTSATMSLLKKSDLLQINKEMVHAIARANGAWQTKPAAFTSNLKLKINGVVEVGVTVGGKRISFTRTVGKPGEYVEGMNMAWIISNAKTLAPSSAHNLQEIYNILFVDPKGAVDPLTPGFVTEFAAGAAKSTFNLIHTWITEQIPKYRSAVNTDSRVDRLRALSVVGEEKRAAAKNRAKKKSDKVSSTLVPLPNNAAINPNVNDNKVSRHASAQPYDIEDVGSGQFVVPGDGLA